MTVQILVDDGETSMTYLMRSQLKTWKFIGMCSKNDKYMLFRRDDLSIEAEEKLYSKETFPKHVNEIEQCYAMVSRQTPEFFYFENKTLEEIKHTLFDFMLNDWYDNMYIFDNYEELLAWWVEPITDKYGKQVIEEMPEETLKDYEHHLEK